MGAWSIGFLFLPTGALFLIAALLSNRHHQQRLILHLGLGAMAALIQIGQMLIII
jgi:hypothetical protein